VPAPRA